MSSLLEKKAQAYEQLLSLFVIPPKIAFIEPNIDKYTLKYAKIIINDVFKMINQVFNETENIDDITKFKDLLSSYYSLLHENHNLKVLLEKQNKLISEFQDLCTRIDSEIIQKKMNEITIQSSNSNNSNNCQCNCQNSE